MQTKKGYDLRWNEKYCYFWLTVKERKFKLIIGSGKFTNEILGNASNIENEKYFETTVGFIADAHSLADQRLFAFNWDWSKFILDHESRCSREGMDKIKQEYILDWALYLHKKKFPVRGRYAN